MQDKRYLIEIPGQEGVAYWGEEKFNANKDDLLKDHPDAIIAEVGTYSADDVNENDSFIINIPGQQDAAQWDFKRFSANKDDLLKDYPNAQIQRVRGVDYWGEKKASLEQQMSDFDAQYGDFLADYEAKKKADKLSFAGSDGKMLGPYTDYVFENAYEYAKRNKEREALRNEYYNNPIVKQEREGDLIAVKDMASKLEEEANAKYKEAIAQYQKEGGNIAARGADKVISNMAETQMYTSALNMLKKAQDTLEAPSKYDDSNGFVNFMKGAGHTFGSVDFWSAGLTSVADNANARAPFERLKKELGTADISELTEEQIDKALTPAEKAMVLAFTRKALADYKRSNDLSLGYQSGQSAAESLGFMAQFLLTSGVTSAASKFVTKGMAKWLASNLGNAMVAKAAPGITKLGAKALQQAGKFALGTTKSLVDAAVRTGTTTTLARSISEQALPNVMAGTLPAANEYILKGLGDAFIENWSEAYGGVLGKMVSTPASAIFGDWGKVIARSSAMQTMERAGFNGYLSELGEEWFGNAMRTITKVDPDALKNFATVDNQIVTMTSFLPMTLIGGGVSMGQRLAAGKDLENKAAELKYALEKAGLNMDEIDALIDYRQQLSPAMLSERFSPIITRIAQAGNRNMSTELFKAAGAFSNAVARYQAFEGAYHTEEQNENATLRDEMMNNMGGNRFWNTRQSNATNENGEAYEFNEVRVVTAIDGSRMFVVGQVGDQLATLDEEGKQGVISQEELEAMFDNNLVSSDKTMNLDQFLAEERIVRRREQESQRMAEERAVQIHDIRTNYPVGSAINLGTRVNPISGVVAQYGANGVVIQTEDKVNPFINVSYEQFAQAINAPIRTLTDEQIAAEEAALIEAERAENETEVADTPEDMDVAEDTVDAASEFEQVAAPTIIPMNEDGTVNEQKFLEENPEEYVAWNDNNRQDNGADSIEQLEMLVPVYQNKYNEAAKAWAANAANPVARRAAKEEMAEWQNKIDRINNLLLQYKAPAQIEQNIAERTVQNELEDLHDGSLNEEEIASNINAHIAEAQTAYDEYAKTAPVMGTDRAAYKQAKAEYEEGLKELEQELNYWNEVKTANENYGKILSQEEINSMDERRIEAMKTRAKELEQQFGSAINIIERPEDVSDKDAQREIAAGRPPMGWFNVDTGKVDIYLPGNTSAQMVEETIFHEVIGHSGLRGLFKTKEEFNQLCDSVYDYMEKNLSASELYGWLHYPNVNEDKRKAADEYMAHIAESVDYNENRTFWDKLIGWIKEILLKRGLRPSMGDEDIVNLLKRSYKKLKENAVNTLEDNGYDVDQQNGDVRFSSRYITNDSQREDIINAIVLETGRTREEAEKWLQSEESAAAMVLADKEYLDYVPDDKYKAIKDNSDYPQGTVDFNNICRKRIPFTKMYTRLQRRYPNRIFTAEELADIRTIMNEDGLVVACGLCYVEDRRQKLGEVADAFIADLKDGFKTYAQANATKQSNAAKFLVMVGSDSYVPTIYDLITLEGSDKLYNEHRGIWEAFGAYNRARGQQTQNTFQGYAKYKREILGWSAAKVKKVNSLGGLRVFSYSDFEAHHLLDLVQIIIDCAAKGVMIQGYTKVPEFARAVAKTGIKLNRSLIPLGDTGIVDGKLAYDPVEGIDINDPNFLESNDNVGNILIGINDEQIRLAMVDPFINYIIPYHARQAGVIRNKLNVGAWKNHIDTQNERDAKTGKRVAENINIYTDILGNDVTNDKEFVEKYLKKCEEMGRIPKFDEFLNKDAEGNYVYTPGYYKFLVDFKLFDEAGNILPQKPVMAEFDDAFNMQILKDYAEGERQTTGEQMNATYDKIVETLGLNEEEAEGEDIRFSTEANSPFRLREEGESAMDFTEAVIKDFKSKYNALCDIEALPVDEVMAARFGYTLERLQDTDGLYEHTDDYDLIAIFAHERNNDGQIVEMTIFHENIHYLSSRDNNLVEFGKWLWDNAEANEVLSDYKSLISQKYGADRYYTEMLSYSVSYMMAYGNTGIFELMLPYEFQDSLKEIENKIGYDRQTEEGIRSPKGIVQYTNWTETLPVSEGENNEGRTIHEAGEEGGVTHESKTLFSTSNNNQAIFVSNAAKAVEGIKMEKATPEQWLKMIEKNGGLKAGEDKWMGLSDWLKASDKKTLTKDEVMQFINDNMIVIEEVQYKQYAEETVAEQHREMEEVLQDKFDAYQKEYHEQTGYSDFSGAANDYAIEKLREEMSDTFPYTIENSNSMVYLTFPYEEDSEMRKWSDKLGVPYTPINQISEVRLSYTTDGLGNKQEIALTVPTIESWNVRDDIHFGDAGEGRAVAWVRFGDTWKFAETTEEGKKLLAYVNQLREKYGIEEEAEMTQFGNINLPDDLIDAITNEELYEYQRLSQESMSATDKTEQRILVIDEIQSKRHQEGREKGYKSDFKNSKEAQRLKAEVDRVTARLLELEKDRRENSDAEQTELARLDILLNEAQSNAEYDAILAEQDKIKAHVENRESEILAVRSERRELAYQLDKQIDRDAVDAISAIPDAPFEKNWQELAMKRMLRYAAENGYDYVAWTKGEQQAERYGIGGEVESIERNRVGDNQIMIHIFAKSGRKIIIIVDNEGKDAQGNEDFMGKSLSEILGKEMADKVLNAADGGVLEGEGLKIGGEGMRGFYDKMLPAFMNKYGKKWGIKVEDINLPNLENGLTMHSVPVTEEMKQSVMEGQLMFSTRQPNQSSESFCLQCMRDYVRKHGNLTTIEVEPVNKETAKKYGLTLEELQKTWGTYVDKGRVVIFAQEDITDSGEVDSTIFHETIHHLVKRYPELKETGKFFWNVKDNGAMESIRTYIETEYAEDSQEDKYEEMLCWAMEYFAAHGGLVELLGHMKGDSKKDVEFILNKTNYDRTEFDEIRSESSREKRFGDVAEKDERQSRSSEDESRETDEGKLFSTVITPEVRREMDVISAQAIVNGNYLKAPNGKDTKLTPEQWALVRTQNFLNWFGDWINDPENASKVVDENGEPMVVYHGTAGVINTFEDQQRSPGFWFVDREDVANGYAESAAVEFGEEKNIIPVFLNIRNPRIEDAYEEYPAEFALQSYVEDDRGTYVVFDTFEEAEAYRKENVPNGWVGAHNIGDQHDLVYEARRKGNDGVIMLNMYDQAAYAETRVEGTQTNFVVLDANQIKSATENTGEYSESKNILFSTGREKSVEEIVERGLPLSIEEYTSLAANIYKALPEDMRKEVVENASRDNWDLKKAIYQMVTNLAKKSNLADEEIDVAKMIADKVQDAVLAKGIEPSRPFTVNEALWMLYNSSSPVDERSPFAMAERAVVANNLGFSPKAMEEEEKDESEIRFRRYLVPQIVSAADAYTKAISYWGNRMNEAFVDQYDAVDQMMKAIEDATGKKAESWEDIRLILTQSASKGLAKLQNVERELIQKMWDAVNEFAKDGIPQERLARYVILKHGLERNELFAKRDARRSYEEEYRDEVKRIKNGSTLSDADKQQKINDAKVILDNHIQDIDNQTDDRYLENRKKDYSGILAMFADYPGLMSEDSYSTEEEYRTARRKSRVLKHKKLANAEAEAQSEIDAFEDNRDTLIKNLWDSVNNLTKGTLKMQHEYGMLSNEAYKNLTGMFKYYVPLRGFSDNTAEDLYDYYGNNVSDGYAPAVMGAKGRKSEAESPFGWMAAMAATAVVAGEKNLAKQALYYFVMNRTANDLLKVADMWYVQSPANPSMYYPAYPPQADPSKTPAENAQQYADWEKQMDDLRKQGKAIKKTNRLDIEEVANFGKKDAPEHVIKVNINGEEKQLIVNANPRAAQAINGLLNMESDPDYQKVLGKVLRWMSQVSTGWNPEFWMTNIARDTITAFYAVNIKEDKIYREAFLKNWIEAWKLVKLLPKLKDGTLGSGRLEDLLKEAVENGVQTGYSHIKSMEEWDKDMEKYLKELNKDEWKVVTAAKSFIDGVQTFSESMELVSRFATYITSRQLGRDVTRAVSDAKEVTVNFNRKGSGMRITFDEAKKLKWADGTPIFSEKWRGAKKLKGLVSVAYVSGISALAPFGRMYMMFFNAGVQGLNMWLQMYRNGYGSKVNMLAGTAFALGILNSVIQGIFDGDDDKYQQSISDYERRSNLMLGAKGYYFKIALPQELKAFYGLGDILYNYAAGNYHHKDTPVEVFRTFASQLVDILPINPMGGWEEFIPSMGKAVVEAGVAVPFLGEVIPGTNKNFAGSPLRDEKKWLSEAERESMPKYAFASNNTWSWLVDIAELANRATGGSEYDAGWLQLDPARIQHYVEQATGGVGGFVGKLVSTVNSAFDSEQEATVSNFPFLGRMFTVADERGQNKLTNEQYYYYKGVAEAAEMRYDKYQQSGDSKKISQERKSDEHKIMKVFFKYESRDDEYKEKLKRAKSKAEEKELKMKRDANRKRFLDELSEKGLL